MEPIEPEVLHALLSCIVVIQSGIQAEAPHANPSLGGYWPIEKAPYMQWVMFWN